MYPVFCNNSYDFKLITSIFSDDFKLAQTFNNYFKSTVGILGIKECEASSDVSVNSRSKDGVDDAIEKYNDHPSINMVNENASFESRFRFKEIGDSDIQKDKKRFLILFLRKQGLSEIFLRKYLRILPIFGTQYFKINGIMRY